MVKKQLLTLLLKLTSMKFRIKLIRAAFAVIRAWMLNVIAFPPMKVYVQKNLLPLEQVADKLTDKDPNNAAQMEALWREYQDDFEQDTIELAIGIVEKKVKDPATRQLIIELLRGELD